MVKAQFFADAVNVAGGAARTAAAVREHLQVKRFSPAASDITREEFEAVKAMAAKARDAQEDLLARLKALEAKLNQP
jgi:BMFP domain-containing protein YqiC